MSFKLGEGQSNFWSKTDGTYHFESRDRDSGKVKWTATSVDLLFGSNSQLRSIAEVYASADGEHRFVQEFADAWAKVMELDRFDIR